MDLDKEKSERYLKFIRQIPSLQATKSTHWEIAIKDFDLQMGGIGENRWIEEVDKRVQESFFGFKDYPSKIKSRFRSLRFWKDYYWAKLMGFVANRMRFLSDSRTRKYEHARALEFLKRKGLIKEYFNFIDFFEIASDMQAARHYFYVHTLSKVIERHKLFFKTDLNFLEIGAGAGNFALFTLKKFNIKRYVIVDLPEMLGYSAYQFLKYSRDVDLVFPSEFEVGKFKNIGSRPTVYFILPDQIRLIPNDSISVSLNFTSFSEMDKEQVENYFSEIYRVASLDSLFYAVNRYKLMKDRRGGFYENNPLLFPYRASDRVLIYKPDDFHYGTRAAIGVIPTFTLMRLAMVKPSPNINL